MAERIRNCRQQGSIEMHRQTVRDFLSGEREETIAGVRGNHNRCSRVVCDAFEIKSRKLGFSSSVHMQIPSSDGRIACKHRASGLPACYQPVIADNRFFPLVASRESPATLWRESWLVFSFGIHRRSRPFGSLNGLVLTRDFK